MSIAQFTQTLIAQESPRPKSLCVTLLGDVFGTVPQTIWMSDLLQMMADFGINERWVRTSVFRLVKENILLSERIGRKSRFQLSPNATELFARASKSIYGSTLNTSWNQQWTVVSGVQARQTELIQQLRWHGFGQIDSQLWAHPNLSLVDAQKWLSTKDNPSITCFEALDNNATQGLQSRVATAWDWETLTQQYAHFYSQFKPLEPLLEQLLELQSVDSSQTKIQSGLTPNLAFILRILLIHAYRRVTLHDPHLPNQLLPPNWIGFQSLQLISKLYKLLYASSQLHLEHMGFAKVTHHRFIESS